MSSSISFTTPMASFSTTDLTINRSESNENQQSFYSSATSVPQRHLTNASVNIPLSTRNDPNVQHHDDDNEEEQRLLASHYDNNRLKQERLLVFTNVLRVLVICVLAPVIYFLI